MSSEKGDPLAASGSVLLKRDGLLSAVSRIVGRVDQSERAQIVGPRRLGLLAFAQTRNPMSLNVQNAVLNVVPGPLGPRMQRRLTPDRFRLSSAAMHHQLIVTLQSQRSMRPVDLEQGLGK